MKDAQNEARLANNLRGVASKSLAVAKRRNKELALKLATTDRDRRSMEASLRNTEPQTEEQCRRLHYTEIELAMAKQQVLELKAELSMAKEAAHAAQAAANTIRQKFYDLKVQETEAQLTEELARVCKEYCLEVWTEALNVAGALMDSNGGKSKTSTIPRTSEKPLRQPPRKPPLL